MLTTSIYFCHLSGEMHIFLLSVVQDKDGGSREKGENMSACKEKNYKRAPALEESNCLSVLQRS
jgi:hypothetical protein